MDLAERERRKRLLEQDESLGVEPVEVAPPRPSPTVVVSVRMPADLADRLTAAAASEGKATGTFTRELIERALADHGRSEWSVGTHAVVVQSPPRAGLRRPGGPVQDSEFAVAS